MAAYQARLTLESPEGTRLGFEGRIGEKHLRLDSKGDPTVPSPVDAVLMALAGCSGMDVISILRKMRQQVTSYSIEVHAERREEHPRIFTKIELIHHVHGCCVRKEAVERAIELSDTKYCSVHAMLHDAVQIESRYEIVETEPSAATR